jgi:hypothetical protein
MGVRVLYDSDQNIAALYCSTTDVAFGPLFQDDGQHDGDERAESFLRWLPTAPRWIRYEKTADFGRDHDPRQLSDNGLQQAWSDWLVQETAQWTREDAPKCEDCGEPVGEGNALCPACMETR